MPEEREIIKKILHTIYVKFVPRRQLIRKSIKNTLITMIHETEVFSGARELLEVYLSAVRGFMSPLKDEHVDFFNSVIIPLHKVSTSKSYHEFLTKCTIVFLTKDEKLAIPLLNGILDHWPIANTKKEILLLEEMLEILGEVQASILG